ncbi:MAG TPA: hypothetical protein PKC28_04700 [Bdellovibrionales bacterium]|nr:hypothetical protein [Bdellovibrionales bacterium]
MLQDFRIVHRRKPHLFSSTGSPVWSTCLRSLAFADHHDLSVSEHDETFQREQAYRFLLEILCGLHSPIVGETEVFGQFKNFAQEWVRLQPQRAALIQRALADAKQLRSRYLSNLGHQSYGSWLRKNLVSRELHILGAGHLAQEILPYLKKQADRVLVHARCPEKVKLEVEAVHGLRARKFDRGALIVAAPLSAAEIETWLDGREPSEIYDLRDTSNTDPLKGAIGLQDIFAQIEQNKARLVPRIQAVHLEIGQRASALAGQALIRPQGWDDLCA